MCARKNGAPEGDGQREREHLPKRPTKMIFLLSERAKNSYWLRGSQGNKEARDHL